VNGLPHKNEGMLSLKHRDFEDNHHKKVTFIPLLYPNCRNRSKRKEVRICFLYVLDQRRGLDPRGVSPVHRGNSSQQWPYPITLNHIKDKISLLTGSPKFQIVF
jgi:hypothetical protein